MDEQVRRKRLEVLEQMEDDLAAHFEKASVYLQRNGGAESRKAVAELALAYCEVLEKHQKLSARPVVKRQPE
jgi:hypothetical protein